MNSNTLKYWGKIINYTYKQNQEINKIKCLTNQLIPDFFILANICYPAIKLKLVNIHTIILCVNWTYIFV